MLRLQMFILIGSIMMKMYNKIAVLAALALIFVGCTKQEHLTYTQLNSSEVDYSDAVEGDALSYGVSMAQSDYFDETVLQLDKSSVLSALGASSLPSSAVLYGYEDGSKVYGPDAYTSTTGFYFDSEGDVCSSADEDAVLYADFNASSLSLTIGQVPEACEVGKTYTFVTGIATASALCPIKVQVEITEAGSWCGYIVGDDGLTYDVYEQVKMDYTPCKVEIDASALCSALGVSSASKIASGISDNSVVFYGMNSDGSLYTAVALPIIVVIGSILRGMFALGRLITGSFTPSGIILLRLFSMLVRGLKIALLVRM